MFVIIIDDDPVATTVLNSQLRHFGFETQCFLSPDQALDAIQKRRPDAVITDIEMPGKDGFEVAKRIRRIHPEVPVIVISSFTSESLLMRMKAEGIMDYLIKPVDGAQLIASLKKTGLVHTADSFNLVKRQATQFEGEDFKTHSIYINLPVLYELARSLGREALMETWNLYRSEADHILVEMQIAMEKRGFDIIKTHAHRLSGSSASLGLNRMLMRSRLIERLAKIEDEGTGLVIGDMRTDFSTTEFLVNDAIEGFSLDDIT